MFVKNDDEKDAPSVPTPKTPSDLLTLEGRGFIPLVTMLHALS
jgi:hypothetical protein